MKLLRFFLEELATLVALALFVAMVLVWTMYLARFSI